MKNHNHPKVKIRELGTRSVTDAELLSLFFRNENGYPTGKAQSLLESVGHNLNALAKLSISDMLLLGVNESAAVYLLAAVSMFICIGFDFVTGVPTFIAASYSRRF